LREEAAVSIRLRLALWCCSILAPGLIVFSTLIYLLAGHTLRTAADEVIAGRAQRLHKHAPFLEFIHV